MKRKLYLTLITVFLLSVIHLTTQAQNRTLKGRVLDDKGSPIPGAAIRIKNNPTVGTVTSGEGTFSLSVPSTADSLRITALSFKEQIIAISDDVEVRLLLSETQMDEVVVVGYGTQRKGDLTAPISTVNTAEMLKRTTATPMDAIQGSVPGVQIITSGAPGSAPDVRVRGIGSFNNTNPLYVVDGMFVENINFLNPNDIAEISVLKDASGAAIYGVRAANGVVLITTKKGKLNMKTRVTYNGYVGVQVPTNVLKMANGAQYTSFSLQRKTPQDSSTAMLSAQRFGGSGIAPTTNTDWYDELLRDQALITNHGIDLQGGSDKVIYSFGINYAYQNGIMEAENNFKRYNIRLQVEANAFSWLKVGFTSTLTNSTQFNAPNVAFSQAYSSTPLFPVYDEQNTNAAPVKFANASFIGREDANPVATAYYNFDREKRFQVLPSIYAEAAFWNNKFTFRSQLSQLYSSSHRINYSPERNLGPGTQVTFSNLRSTQERNTNYILDNLLTYKDSKGAHHWSILLGQSTREERWRQTWVSADNVPNIEESWYVNQGTRNAGGYNEDGVRNATLSYFTRGTYDFDNKYLLTATFRADGSSKYQTKWGYFPSVGLGWVLTNENFMKGQRLFDFLKLRGSWGKLGNDGVNANAAYAIVNSGNPNSAIFGSTATADGQYLPGYNVKRNFTNLLWEIVTEWDGGIDFEALNRRLSGSVDYYHRTTTGSAFNKPLSSTYDIIYGNWADMANSGFDVQLNWSDKIGKLSYHIGGNFSTLKNRVTNLGSLPASTSGFPEWMAEFPNRIVVGQPINYFYGYEFIGVYQTDDEISKDPISSNYNSTAIAKIQPGFPKYKDQDGDGELTNADRVNIGSYIPTLSYGFNLGLEYANIDFSIFFQGVSGNKILNLNRGKLYKASTSLNIDEEFASNLWTGPGSTNAYPSANALRDSWFKVSNSFFTESGAYLRIQNIQLGYNFNLNQNKAPIKMRVFATADRPFIFSRYNGFTPEVSGLGYDVNVYPISATYSFGVRATF
ncbi:SusC/RagA family TonB-linked outer membrane protein [Chitinophaga sp. SYP-B3965]|uniref:SusC/RagA family TonB-linked outer membrane protein n=1 Tax=Chitinophaga sp. SYP-B3965 TaxID=2663120 RepID=UPI001299DEAD|nr:TonB-dependent receptor [Chitinophaga sp. SYP-B3965]MRG45086.1 SusC/RagA family TonB-linked outer membrane protein [Chitinophaga sp. SYP-B3965]